MTLANLPPMLLPGVRARVIVRPMKGLAGTYRMTYTCPACSRAWQAKEHDCFEEGGRG